MKRLLYLLLIGLIPLEVVMSEIDKTGYQVATVTDSLAATDTVGTTDRTDSAQIIFDVSNMTKFGLVITTLSDTSFVDDTTLITMEYSVNYNGSYDWKWLGITALDTLVKDTADNQDTTYIAYIDTDTLGVLIDYIRLTVIHYDAVEVSANNVGIFENTYSTTATVGIKGWK